MTSVKKRPYQSKMRKTQAIQTKTRILLSAKKLFQTKGFDNTTIEKIAQAADVSVPTVYALFQSKRGILQALMDNALYDEQYAALIQTATTHTSPIERLKATAKICREMYDAERAMMDIFRGAAVVSPELKLVEQERETRRYERQADSVKKFAEEKFLKKGISVNKARDLIWMFTGRDLYRMLVIERNWSSSAYEKWLTETLIHHLLN